MRESFAAGSTRTTAESSAVREIKSPTLQSRIANALVFVRGMLRELRNSCPHRNTHRPLAYLTKCWDCGARRVDGGLWTLGGAR